MKCFIAKLKIKAGREAELERLQTELSQLTHQHEPETLVYDVLRSTTEQGVYIVYGRFKDEAAFQLHQTTAFHDRLVPPIVDTLAGDMDLQFYEWVA
jgi:quinol monooxygenase YgiN